MGCVGGNHSYTMPMYLSASTLLCLLIRFTLTEPVLNEGSLTFDRPIHNIATGRQHVVVATENTLHLFNHMLHTLAEKHPASDSGTKKSNTGNEEGSLVYYNKILLVYNDIVLSCWTGNSGTCKEYSANDLTLLEGNGKDIVSEDPKLSAAGFIWQKYNKTIFVTASPTQGSSTDKVRVISLREKGLGNVFTFQTPDNFISFKDMPLDFNFVDAFEWSERFIFPYYLSNELKARLLILEERALGIQFNSQYNLTCGTERGVILSSFAFASSGSYFWAGVFSTNRTASPDRTALCIYNITSLKGKSKGCIHTDFFATNNDCETYANPLPIHSKPTISHGDLTAVFVLEVQNTLVLFLGTGNGRLLKVTLDSNYIAKCPQILHQFNEEAAVFRTIRLDPVNNTYLYVATVNEIKRVRIAKCEQYQSCNECLAAADPHCGWCQLQERCTMKSECARSTLFENWIKITEDYGKCLGIHIISATTSQITISIKKISLLFGEQNSWSCEIQNKNTERALCSGTAYPPFLNCSCSFPTVDTGVVLTAKAESNDLKMLENFQFDKCSQFSQFSQFSCLECISNGCLYCTSESACRSPLAQCAITANEAQCKIIERTVPKGPPSSVKVTSVKPDRITYAGKRNVLITGENLQNLSRMFLVGAGACKPQEVQIKREKQWNNTHAYISLPKATEIQQLCVHFDGTCHQGLNIFYETFPTCCVNAPNVVWLSGGRNISLLGKGLDLVDEFSITGNTLVHKSIQCLGNITQCYFIAGQQSQTNQIVNINIHFEENTIKCGMIHYKPNPTFSSYTADFGDNIIEVRIKKQKDELHIRADEIQVRLNSNISCKVQNITEWMDEDTVFCEAKRDASQQIDLNNIRVEVILGNYTQLLRNGSGNFSYMYFFLVIPLLLVVLIATCVITRYRSKQLSVKLSKQLETLECDIRQEIRDGFAEFQMDKEVVTVEALGTIPFFDYKHFALKTFFPESDESRQDLSEQLYENVPSPFQKNPRTPADEDDTVTILKNLFQNQNFLVHVIHILEKQKNFTVKDRCMFASFLTITFQNNLLYLTALLENLIRDLIEQSSSKNPKLMLRRTETVVEKLLTNWMATCLYGFLRESVGEPLYGLVCTLNQRIHKGPIDVITCKALYTLNEDWLLWQVTDFKNIDINVHYTTPEGEDVNSSQCIKATVLDCDTIGQVKEKILQTFLLKNGYAFSFPLCDICLELHYGQSYKELLDVDASSVVMENGLKRLNTVAHYKIENGATIKIINRKNCDPVEDYSSDYVHLELPEAEESDDLQNMEKKGKQKFKVKEMYLTKLLSTKVAIHSSVEKLFRSIWTISHRPPVAIKYFFDFLDAHGEIRKISDPDILHIWKTNSLPLRFWINILKNPQFVLDIKKTALLESCLSVIAQAFMDGFSLTEQQLGKSAPTNKLLYAKDIPQFKDEVRSYYKNIRDAPSLSSTELTEFLTSESKKHEHEFKSDVAILELYKYIEKYSDVILSTLEKETGFDSEVKQLLTLQKISKDKNKCTWE